MKRICFCSLIWLCFAMTGAAQNLLANAGFEGNYTTVNGSATAMLTGVTALSWSENSNWATLAVDYARETNNPHGGEACQRIHVKSLNAGAMQLIQRFDAAQGRVYQFTVWVRGLASGSYIELIYQRNSTPYNTYTSRSYFVGEGWRKISLTAALPETTRAAVMIRTTAPTTFWVDDAELRDVSDTIGGEERGGNLFPNASFEAAFADPSHGALGNGWFFHARGQASLAQSTLDEFTDPRPAPDRSTSADGQQSLRVDLAPRSAMQFASPQTQTRAGQTYTASVALRSTVPGVGIQLEIVGTTLVRYLSTTTSWQRYSLSGAIPFLPEGARLRLTLRSNVETAVWLDAAQFNEGAGAEYQAMHETELAVLAPAPGAIFTDDQITRLKVAASGNLPAGALLRRALLDIDQRATDLPDLALPADEFALDNLPRGLFKLRTQIVSAQGQPLSAVVETVFARLPRPRDVPKEKSFFGAHSELNSEWLQVTRALGAKWVRLHDASKITKWRLVEETKGSYRYYDEGVNLARQMGIGILGMVDGAPPWASATPRATEGYFSMYNLPNAPGALQDWRAYCKTVAAHYAGGIDHWEVWNEPWGGGFFPNGTPQLYGELLRNAFEAIREANPLIKGGRKGRPYFLGRG